MIFSNCETILLDYNRGNDVSAWTESLYESGMTMGQNCEPSIINLMP